MSRDLRFYLLLVCLPAVVLTGLGLFFLKGQADADAAREVEMGIARIENLAASVQDLVNENGKADGAVRTALARWTGGDGVRKPVGAFMWSPKERLLWTTDDEAFDAGLRARLSSMSRWNEWTAEGKRRARRGLMAVDRFAVLWGRVDAVAYGLVFDGPPLLAARNRRSGLWSLAIILVVLLGGVLGAGVWLMARAVAKARRDDMTKTTFLSNCSHELKTPLAGIGIWIDLLKNGHLSDEMRAHAHEVIFAENARMTRLVENLLDFSRLEQGRRRYCMQAFDLGALVSSTAEVVRGGFAEHGLDVRVEGEVRACADADAVRQILVNLLGNAEKYAAASGPVDVCVAAVDGMARVVVADRGPGLSPKDRKRVFERFYRVDDALTAKTGGLGLGLAISRSLARDMGGDLSVDARAGGGCAFTLELKPAPLA